MLPGDHEILLPEPENYAKCLYDLFKSIAEALRYKTEWRKLKKNKSIRKRDKKKVAFNGDLNHNNLPEIELSCNASAFAVFASVRSAVLEKYARTTSEAYRASNCNSPLPPELSDTIDTESDDEDKISTVQSLPKIVGIGLRSVFTLMRESRTIEPILCTKALSALLNVLQGQLPEGLKFEPDEVIDPLFDLLLDLATSHGPESAAANDGSHLTAVACACLLSLAVVRGDTGRLLIAVAALLMSPRALAVQKIQMPSVLTSLQRSVHAVLLGKLSRPDWITYGVPKCSKVYSFMLKLITEMNNVVLNGKSFVSNGRYLYLHTNRGLLKIGSGHGGTILGHIYIQKADFYPTETGWLGYANNCLYFKCAPRKQSELLIIDAETLAVTGIAVLEGRDWLSSVMFSDGDNLGMITADKDDGFVVRTINTLSNPVTVATELPLKLARKCVDTFGYAAFDEEQAVHTLNPGCDDEIAMVTAGKEFGLIKTVSGKILYSGKGSCLGMKSNTRPNRWLELTLGKRPRLTNVAVGHDGQHIVMVMEDGSVLFAGTATRGEDGDSNKVRRQAKPVKPKKITKVEGQFMIDAACNNGSTALVTKEGSLFMFGKDTLHSDPITGLVTDLKDVCVVNVSLGKAHAGVLTNKGHLYTFGINNKGQCGRDFVTIRTISKDPGVVAMETASAEDELTITEEDPSDDWDDTRGMCPSGLHQWRHRVCMVCTICRECTGYSISCLSSIRPDRKPGQECGCGEGDSGCAVCGCCRTCAGKSSSNGMSGSHLREYLRRRLGKIKQRQRIKAGPSVTNYGIKLKDAISQRTAGPSIVQKASSGKIALGVVGNLIAEEFGGTNDVERSETTRIASIPPAKVVLPSESSVVEVSCGLHHTVVLLQNGEVYTFGSNVYGQLGVGDLQAHAGPVQVKLPSVAVQVAAGSNHTVVLTSRGEVYTYGAYQKGQLGMNWWSGQNELPNTTSQSSHHPDRSQTWHSFPNLVPNIGPRWGRRATWIGAAGDQTYIKIDEINSISLTKSTVMANKNCIILIPHKNDIVNSFKCLVINKRDGTYNSYSGIDQVDFSNCAACLDPLYNVTWTFNSDNNEISLYNVIPMQTKRLFGTDAPIFRPDLALPIVSNCFVTRSQAAMHLLACLDTLTQAQDANLTISEESESNQSLHNKIYSREDFVTVGRFESHGGGWGYSSQSVEAIRFMPNTDILLGGYGLFGGRGEYTAKIKLFDIGMDGGDQENDGELLAESEETPYECGPLQKYSILFDEPVPLQANRWYVAWAIVSGPSSDCGTGGQGVITAEDQVVFYFKSSRRSNNGTDVNAGQIPQLLYRIVTHENQSSNRQRDPVEPVYILKREFSRTVTKECFQSLISLLQWSWNTVKIGLTDTTVPAPSLAHALLEMESLVYISKASLRLLRIYTNEIYPNQVGKRTPPESIRLAECIGDVRALLCQILSDSAAINTKSKGKTRSIKSIGAYNSKKTNGILEECHKTFVSCYHAFYPTAYFKWTSLCELLLEIDRDEGTTTKDRLLSAMLAALCSSNIRLRSTFPILNNTMDNSDSIKRQLNISNNTGLLLLNSTESHSYPVLVEQISQKTQMENAGKEVPNWTFRDVLDRLLDLILIPVKKSLCQEKCQSLPELVLHCSYLMARVIAELAGQSSGNEDELQAACGRLLYTTPSRFTRVNETRSWNTGNGSPDAICFSVDRPGIAISGVGIYGGVGGYEYELELLDDQTNTGNDRSHTQRWSSLDFTRGSFGPEDCVNEIVELKFDKPVPIKENVKYAIRLRNRGGRTSNGDGGLSIVKGPDGTSFSFTSCSLSFNGTNLTRGQIPHILYYSNPQDMDGQDTSKAMAEVQARKSTLAMTSTIIQRANEILALARERAEDGIAAEVLGNATFVTTLLPLVMAHISPLATSDPRSGVQVLTLIQEMLPHVTALNLLSAMGMSQTPEDNEIQTHASSPVTTSHHYTWLESGHPYKSASVSHYKVTFPDTVKWLTIEFTPECGTAQPEDYLQLYIPNRCSSPSGWVNRNRDDSPLYWPVLHKLSNVQSQWPQNAIVLPGNEVVFSLETATDYMKNEKAVTYGFKCLVIGYDWITSGNGLQNLEIELSFLGGACAASLMKKNLPLPPVSSEEVEEDLESMKETAKRIFSVHSALLGRGFALASPPTISQSLDGVLPFSCQSNERLFLLDFVCCSSGTSGGRLARWLQPDSFVDPMKCEAIYSQDEMRCGRPTIVTVITKDQYGDVVHVAALKVDIKAVPIDKKDLIETEQGRKVRRVFQPDPMTFGGHPYPSLDVPYEVTVHNNMCFYSITIMKAYENYSFEELRLMSLPMRRPSESMLVRPNGDGSYSATWTPSSSGWYSLIITIDGYKMEDNYKVEVKKPPQGVQLPMQNIVRKPYHQPSRLRKFVGKNSRGLRIRAYPSLQSEQIGIIPINGTVTFMDEIHNNDGVWLRLNADTIKEYCHTSHLEAWSLQYNQHLKKTLLLPVEESKPTVDLTGKEISSRKKTDMSEDKRKTVTFDGNGTMVVVKCGASGHNIRSRPSVKSAPVGMLALGNAVAVQEYFVNNEGTWVRIDEDSVMKYCFDRGRVADGEAWSLAANKHGVTYMKIEQDLEVDPLEKKPMISDPSVSPTTKGFDFSVPSGSHEGFSFTTQNYTSTVPEVGESSATNPFVFGTVNQHDSSGSEKLVCEKTNAPPKPTKSKEKSKEKESGSKFSVLQKWLRDSDKKDSDTEKRSSPSRDFAEFAGVSVKELIKAMGESRANGNSTTPPETPRKTSTSSSPKNSQGGSSRYQTPSSSPVPIPAGSSRQPVGSGNCLFPPAANAPGGRSLIGGGDSISSSPVLCGSPRSVGLSPLVSGGMADSITSQRRGSTQSDTSALVSSLTRDPSQSPSAISTSANTRDPSPSPSCSSLHMRSEGPLDGSPPDIAKKDCDDAQEHIRNVCQAQTQTSPENVTSATKAHFTIGSANGKEDRGSTARVKRAMSPNNSPQGPNASRTVNATKDKVKEAISPSVAESLRAVFAAFLWHEGIVHDAMACASFLKFHPSLPKEGAVVVTRQTVVHAEDREKQQQKARQRHSVEVTNAGNYLHIQPSTLETLTRSAANANANRNRKKQEAIIKEESQTGSKLTSLPEFHTVAVLPPALKSLVFLWEELSTNCLQAIEEQSVLSSPISQSQSQSQLQSQSQTQSHMLSQTQTQSHTQSQSQSQSQWQTQSRTNSLSQTQSQTTKALRRSASETRTKEDKVKEREKRRDRKRMEWKSVNKGNAVESSPGIERETACELCSLMFPHPVTYHMKMMHPGCGWHAGGKGYNSGGNYCVGWAGNCGDGGVSGCSWYLLCDTCRDKYLTARNIKLAKKFLTEMSKRRNDNSKISSPGNSPAGNETHIIMKNNAMFLLDLASASGLNIPKQQRRPSQTLSSVAENYSPPETSNPFPPTGPFQCRQALGIHHSQSHDERYYEETLMRQNGQHGAYEENGNMFDAPHGRLHSEHPMSDSMGETSKTRGVFHRSVSMSTGGPWTKNSNDGRVVMMRKRNNSSSETNNDAGSSLLCYPSAALQKLVPSMDQSAIVSTSQTEVTNNDRIELLMRPVMLFVLEQHNLKHLQLAMKQALRRAACRVYAMQALNWLLRSVTQPICLHDLLWWFVASLTPVASTDTAETNEDDNRERREDQDLIGVCEHPLSDLMIAGESVNPLPTVFHTLLQTIADLMLLPPPGSPLQQAAIRCWGIRFTPADHMFLHRSHVFSNISKILSKSEEEEDVTMSMHESHQSTHSQQNCTVEVLKDITSSAVIEASSRQAMVGCLTDNSTETFWESGDEDRNKTKTITISCCTPTLPRMLYIHIDNCRDLTHKVSCVTFLSGINADEMAELRTVEIESRSAGWISCPITDSCHFVVGLELKGPDNSLRIRQIRVLGIGEGVSAKVEKQLSAQTIQQRNCESETLKVFRLITSQVFGKLIQGDQQAQQAETTEGTSEDAEESNDLREHMVGILFSRSNLTHLQKQVCTHIVQAIRKETIRLREEWEALLCSPTPFNSVLSDNSDLPKAADTYCFEMLSMVLALSGSSVGRHYLSQQYGLLKDLLSLLHTGSARVQRQVTSLLKRILPDIKPEALANIVSVEKLPPTDFSIVSAANNGSPQATVFDEHSPGILDVFLSCIAKALTVQVKVKGKENGKALQTVTLATSSFPKDYDGSRWWLRGCMSRKLAEVMIQLLKDMASGKLSEAWAAVTKAAIAENILNLTRLDENNRDPTECLRTPTLWLALSSLCVLDSEHVEQLSSGQWSGSEGQPPPPRPTCSNHDDGETTAIIQCNVCGTLCAECDRILHLHRRTKTHIRQVCKEEEEAIRVDLHEGCGRMKLFWVLALADSTTLKALVEFRDGASGKLVGATSGICRFCGTTGNTGLLAIGNVCADHDCQEHGKSACNKVHPCGHICGGVRNEEACLPCLHRCLPGSNLKQDADDMCMICFTEALSAAPAIQLKCGHVFHLHCCRHVLMKRWVGPRITFGFSLCPICKVPMEHTTLADLLKGIKELYEDVRRKALMRLEYEGLHKAEAAYGTVGRYQQDSASYAMERYAYYVCYKCQKAYYGGEARCDAQIGGESFDPTELVCGGCSDVARAQMCPKHGTDFLEYKCRYCCSMAVFFCFGTTHFCNPCHENFQRVTTIPKSELPSCPAGPRGKRIEGDECPLHVKHPPTGEEFALGCGICRNAHAF